MPLKLKTRCRHPGCIALTRSGWCDQHQQSRYVRAADRQRGNSTQRGYDHRWRRLRDWYVSQHPLCEDCLEQGTLTAASATIEVDHILPIAVRPDLRLDADNLRSLCRRHHKLKTDRDRQLDASARAATWSTLSTLGNGSDLGTGGRGGRGRTSIAWPATTRGQHACVREIGDRGGNPSGPDP